MRLEDALGPQREETGDVMIGAVEQWSEEPLERRISSSLAAPHGFTWRSKTIKYVSFKHSVNREVRNIKNCTLEKGQMDWLSDC